MMVRPIVRLLIAVGMVGWPAFAQEPDPAPSGEATGESGDVAETTTSRVYIPPPGFPQPGTDINAGLPSSSRPITGGETDTFDLNRGDSGSPVVHGNEGATGITLPSSRSRVEVTPDIHVVRKGDTLWDLCAHYFDNPWRWPKLWARNPQVTNPHWIYPGDELRMRSSPWERATDAQARFSPGRSGQAAPGSRSFIGHTLFFREQGFIGDPKRDVWGELVGAREDQMLLSQGNHVYLQLREDAQVRPGQELTIFRTIREPDPVEGARRPPGAIVAIKGTVRIDHHDEDTGVARGLITESVDVIERGAQIGPVDRAIRVVEPKPSDVTLWARVLTSIYPHVMVGQNQVVFIDKGSKDGLERGNQLLVVRKGDTWRRSLATASKMGGMRLRTDASEHVAVERTPLKGDEEKFPAEVVAQLQVLRTEEYSSLALVTESDRELVPGDRAIARKGY